MKKKLLLVLIITLILVSLTGTSVAFAAEEPVPTTPTVSANDYTTEQGSYAYITVRASDFTDIASIELLVYYDSNYFEFCSSSKQSMLDKANVDINSSTLGEARLSAISTTTLEGSGDLWYITFRVKDTTPVGKYPITLAVGEAYGQDLSSKEIKSNNFYINVTKQTESLPTMYTYANSVSAVKQNEEFDVVFNAYNCYNFSAADFEIDYDKTKLQLVSTTLGAELTSKQNAIYSINDKVAGYIKASYTATEGVSSAYPLLTVRFKVLNNEDASTRVSLSAANILDKNLKEIVCNGVSTSVQTVYVAPIITNPKITLNSYNGYDKDFTVDLTAEKLTKLAAGDFVLTYDTTYLICKDVTKVDDSTMLVVNPKFNEGTIKFSFISESGISKDTIVARVKFGVKKVGNTTVSVTGNNLVDSKYNALNVDFISSNITINHEIVHVNRKKPTCTEDGYTEHDACLHCDYKVGYSVLKATGHTPSEVVIENKVLPTCTKQGSYDEVVYCSVCHAEISRVHKTIEATGHSFGDWSVVTNATCTTTGLEHRYCSVCNHEETKIIPVLDHNWSSEWIIDVEPTCTHEGSKSHHCTRCSEKKDVTVIEKLAHTPSEIVIENKILPTCTKQGLYDEVVYCSVCHAEISRVHKTIKATGHSFGDWSVVTYATCTTTGLEHRYCRVCNHEETRVIPIISHKFGEWIVDKQPTCTETGKKHRECKSCKTIQEEIIKPTGHNFVKEIHAPTCTESGFTIYSCTNCDKKYLDEFVPATGHNYGEWVVIKQPTNTETGLKEKVCHCGHKQTEIIPKLNVDFGDTTASSINKPLAIGLGIPISVVVIITPIIIVCKKKKK